MLYMYVHAGESMERFYYRNCVCIKVYFNVNVGNFDDGNVDYTDCLYSGNKLNDLVHFGGGIIGHLNDFYCAVEN